jgi:hypothetical protein
VLLRLINILLVPNIAALGVEVRPRLTRLGSNYANILKMEAKS